MSTLIKQSTGIQRIDVALGVLGDAEASLEDRTAAYAVIQQIRLRLDRALKASKDDLIVGMERAGLRELGPVSVKASAVGVEWPCNDEGNWADSTVQEAMELYAKVAPEYFRHVPDHWEVRTAELGAGVAADDPVAKRLHRELKEHGWRTEEARRLSLAVREPKKGKAAA